MIISRTRKPDARERGRRVRKNVGQCSGRRSLARKSRRCSANAYANALTINLVVRTIFNVISNSDTAKQIIELMLDLFQRVDASVETVNSTCPPEEAAAYERAAGRVACPIVMDVLEPLYERNPTLKPPNWDE
jgi:hypothetical protein